MAWWYWRDHPTVYVVVNVVGIILILAFFWYSRRID